MHSNVKDLTSKDCNGAEKLTKNLLDQMRSATVSISAIVQAVSAYLLVPSKPFDVRFFALLCFSNMLLATITNLNLMTKKKGTKVDYSIYFN